MPQSVVKQVADLDGLSYAQLKDRWRTLCGSEPPTVSRAYLVRRLAYRLQELAFGGLPQVARERLEAIADELEKPKAVKRRKDMPVPGTRLIREWDGRRHEVTVTREGFEYEGLPYRSLSAIARAITGTRWNGPAFFGLRSRKRAS